MEAQPCRTDGSISPRLFRKGVTQYQITEIGIKQFEEYVVFLESVIADKNICECVFCTYES